MKRTVVISGGSDGLGKEIAKILSEKENVIIISPSEEKLIKVSRSLNCDYRVCDISDAKQVAIAVRTIIDHYKQIDCLINNAGIYIKGEVDENSIKDIENVIKVNVLGTMFLTKETIPFMKKQKKGIVINIISKDGLYAKPNRSIYGTSKWAITGFTKYLQHDLPKHGIRVTGIYPGRMKTNLLIKHYPNEKVDLTDRIDCSEVAKTIKFILSQKDTILYSTISIKHIKN